MNTPDANRKPRPRRWFPLVALALVCWLPPGATAATPWEDRAYEVVLKLFSDGINELAEREAGAFLQRYPASARAAEVALVRAQANLELARYDQAIAVLTEYAGQAGTLADEFAFWLAEARFRKGDLVAAADQFAAVNTRFPTSERRFEACYAEVLARFQQGDAAKVIERLRDPQGPYQTLSATGPDNEWMLRCGLLLAEALLRQRDHPAAEATLEALRERTLGAALDWQRQYLLASVRLAAGRPADALAHTTNFWTVATNVIRADLLAEAAVLEGRINEKLDQPEAAIRAYERNLSPEAPRAWRQSALQHIIDLGLSAGNHTATATRLEQFIQNNPGDALLDLARLTLGELRLADYRASKAAGQPALAALEAARNEFDRVVKDFPQSPLAGRAWLDLGWCYWEPGPPQPGPAAEAFAAATRTLPRSLQQVEARLKWADSQFRLGDFSGAITNYWQVATNYPDLDGLATNTVAQALYQVVRASVETGDLNGASSGLTRLLATAGDTELAPRAQLLLGQAFNRQGSATAARSLYQDFVERFTNSVLLPEGRLGLARTFEQAGDWPTAIGAYQQWLTNDANRPGVDPALPAQVRFDIARLSLQTRSSTNGIVLLSRFIEDFPTNANVALAQYLLGEHYFRAGDFGKAELHFMDRSLIRPDPGPLGELPYQSRLMAGRAAVARQNYRNAREHFDWIITNGPLVVVESPIPASVAAQAYLLRGDTFLAETPPAGSNPRDSFGEAIVAYERVTKGFPTNALAPVAWGRIGDCELQIASQDPRRYQSAAEAYRRVVDSDAPASTRSMAECGLALVLEKQAATQPEAARPANLGEALNHYLQVFYGKNLRDGETADPYWVKRAGLAAIDLAESAQRTELAIGLCQRLIEELPPLRARLEKRLSQLRAADAARPGPG
ncbi:MAG: tetratricopeptide repeat protein [Verrucomicrobiales bacterium]|nr:tetratricopeptide repeat protein [Verrucomicrobiales bacterium]MCP5526015.1 tetratricopeptide repeat protein [Verrucomicrobiales bacterium]